MCDDRTVKIYFWGNQMEEEKQEDQNYGSWTVLILI
jgi:hypothetical protein